LSVTGFIRILSKHSGADLDDFFQGIAPFAYFSVETIALFKSKLPTNPSLDLK
jgi:hypothetical protein